MKILPITLNNDSTKSKNEKLGFKMLKVEHISDAFGVFESHCMLESILGQKAYSIPSALKELGEKGRNVHSNKFSDDTFVFHEELEKLGEGNISQNLETATPAKITLGKLREIYKSFNPTNTTSEREGIVSQARNLFGLG